MVALAVDFKIHFANYLFQIANAGPLNGLLLVLLSTITQNRFVRLGADECGFEDRRSDVPSSGSPKIHRDFFGVDRLEFAFQKSFPSPPCPRPSNRRLRQRRKQRVSSSRGERSAIRLNVHNRPFKHLISSCILHCVRSRREMAYYNHMSAQLRRMLLHPPTVRGSKVKHCYRQNKSSHDCRHSTDCSAPPARGRCSSWQFG
jgi:hypothetical protein